MEKSKQHTHTLSLFILILNFLLVACSTDDTSTSPNTDNKQEEKITLDLGGSITLDASKQTGSNINANYHWGIQRVPQGSSLQALADSSSLYPVFTPDIEGTYQLLLTIDDGITESETIFTITVNKNVSQSGGGSNASALVGAAVTLTANGIFDGNTNFNWQVKSVPANSVVNINSLSDIHGANPVFIPDVSGDFIFLLTATNSFDISIISEITISAFENNTPPVANAGNNKSVVTLTAVTLSAQQSYDADDDPLSYSWSLLNTPALSALNLQEKTSSTLTFTPDLDGIYEFLLTISDGSDTDTATVTITASSPTNTTNHPPVAKVGPDQNTMINQTVSLDGSASTDEDNDTLSYQWIFVDKPANSNAVLASATTSAPEFTPDVAGVYSLSLVVNDGKADSNNAAIVIINVTKANSAPIANAGTNLFARMNHAVNLDGSNSVDADQDELSYAWQISSAPVGHSAILSNNTTSTTQFTPDVAGEYVVKLEVSDGENTSQASVTVTVENAYEGTVNQPKALSYTAASRFPYHAETQNGASFYEITGLDANTDYHIVLTDLTGNVDLLVFGDNGFHNVQCSSRNNLTRHENCIGKIIATDASLYLKIDNTLAPVATQYTLNISPAIDEGTAQQPVTLSLDTPHLGTTQQNTSYYVVENIDTSKHYVVSLKDKTGTLSLWAAYDSNPQACHLTLEPEKNYLCTIQTPADNSLRIQVLHNVGETALGKSFELLVTQGLATESEGTLNTPVPLNYNGTQLKYSNGKVDTNSSYYQLNNLTIGSEYEVWLADTTDFLYIDIVDESGTALTTSRFVTQYSFTASASTASIYIHGDESKTGSGFTLFVRENIVQPQSEGTITNPLELSFDTSQGNLAYAGSVSAAANSFYKITNLPTDQELVFAITNLSDNADLAIYSDADFSSLICESVLFQLNDEHCAHIPQSSIVYMKINGSSSLNGVIYNLSVAPPGFEHEGSASVPIELDNTQVSSTGYAGTVDTENSYYKINNLLSNTAYEIRLEQPSGDVDLYVYSAGFESASQLCLSENWEDTAIESCIATTTDTSLLVKVSGAWSGNGASFVIKAVQQ